MTASRNKKKLVGLMAVCAVGLLFFAGCGQKGRPTMKSFEKPSPVGDMRAYHSDGNITISWSYAHQANITIKGFYIERAVGQAPLETIAFVKGDATQYIDDHFQVGKEYRYKIRVYSLRNVISDESVELKVTPVKLPEPPKDLAFRLTNDAVEITWVKVADGISYNIYRGIERGKCDSVLLNAKPLEKPYFKDAVNASQTVFYSVKSLVRTSIINEGAESECLEVNPQSFLPSIPADVRFVRTAGKLYLSWKGNPETWLKGYRVYRKKGTGQFMPVGDVQMPLFVDEEPINLPTSYYITALGPVKESSPSKIESFNP
ncbi:MAG: hypothetical protein ACLP29_14650 [Dissulfurispiraceae bacterium]